MTEERQYFTSLDGVRALAAMAVVVFHFVVAQGWARDVEVVGRVVGRLGNLGVCVFFLLSGFVLYRPRATRSLDGLPQERLARYLPFRLLRILPAYWLALAFLLFTFWHRNPYDLTDAASLDWRDHVRFFGLLQAYDPTHVINGLGVAWTLSIEVAFSATLPLIGAGIAGLSRNAGTIGLFRRRQLLGVVAFSLIGVTSRLVLLADRDTYPEAVSWPINYLDWFGMGMLLAVLSIAFDRGARPGWVSRHILMRPRWAWTVAGALFVALAVGLPPQPAGQFGAVDLHLRFLGNSTIAFLFLAPLVLGQLERAPRLEAAPMQFLGRVSYGIYLWHLIWILAIEGWVDAGLLPDWWALEAALLATFTVGSATLTFTAVEEPIMAWKARWRARTAPDPAMIGRPSVGPDLVAS